MIIKNVTTADYNKFTNDIATNKTKTEALVDKSAISGSIDNTDLNKKSGNISKKSWIRSRKRQYNKIAIIWFKLFLG